jgi:hypothetical protein
VRYDEEFTGNCECWMSLVLKTAVMFLLKAELYMAIVHGCLSMYAFTIFQYFEMHNILIIFRQINDSDIRPADVSLPPERGEATDITLSLGRVRNTTHVYDIC